jgi:predicted TIM-barrel fold metal-dependent hydrolase
MTDFKIIDAHHHLWAPETDPGQVGYVWLKDIGAPKTFGDPTPIQRDYLLQEFLSEPNPRKLAGSVYLQCDPNVPDPVAETAFIQRLSDASGHPMMIVAFADLTRADFAKVLARHQAFPNLRGIRQIISYLPERPDISFAKTNLLEDPTWRANYPTLAQAGLSFDLQLYPEQMSQAVEFLALHPDIPVVIDHLGSPYDTSASGLAQWRSGMETLAALPHLCVKTGGTAMYLHDDLGAGARYLVEQVLRLFGPDRVMFASNFPVDSLHLSYDSLLAFVLDVLGTNKDLTVQMMHDNAHRFYRF